MSLRRTYGAAVTVAGWQAIASALLTAATLLILTSRGKDPSFWADAAIVEPESLCLDMLYRLTTADVAALLVIMALSIDRLFRSANGIRRAIHAADPGHRAALLERMSTLCLLTIFVCVLGLCFAPSHLLVLFNKDGLAAVLVFLWPMILTVIIAFFWSVFIAALKVKRPEA